MPSQISRAYLPFLFVPSAAVCVRLGRASVEAAVIALRAVLLNRKTVEVAHQQVRFRGVDLAFSSRITARGELVIDLDIGDPALSDRIILEEDLRRATRASRTKGVSP
jgi:hypothetical protein